MSEMNLEDKLCKNLEDSCIKAYNAGQQSMQVKIDDLQSQLNNMEACYIQKKKQVEAVEHVLGCAMIGPKEVFMYANRIQKALRGEHENTN
ncbi:hypothetical protein [Acinetobacter terrae]|uniref:hypothetical protein n=1 Tax=Acinetobacter terrae TaxID=2731247 RepID=UPI0007D81F27|nr:hypothetical protein [Acinetobacter terrae]OAL80334.1 hypothetical protein AY608_05510 [Acinetobacter terrae]